VFQILVLGKVGSSTSPAIAASIEIITDEPGIGKHPAADKDLLLVHYVGK